MRLLLMSVTMVPSNNYVHTSSLLAAVAPQSMYAKILYMYCGQEDQIKLR